MNSREELLRPEDVSRLTGFDVGTLANRRRRHLPPAWIKPPGSSRVLYRLSDVQAWLEAGRHPALD
jgi:hypothetical protein